MVSEFAVPTEVQNCGISLDGDPPNFCLSFIRFLCSRFRARSRERIPSWSLELSSSTRTNEFLFDSLKLIILVKTSFSTRMMFKPQRVAFDWVPACPDSEVQPLSQLVKTRAFRSVFRSCVESERRLSRLSDICSLMIDR